MALGLLVAGCTMPVGFGDFFGKVNKSDVWAFAREPATGAIAGASVEGSADSEIPSEADLTVASAAVVDVLQRNRKDISAPWENPANGARGTVTPIANAYRHNGATCHDVLVSYVRGKAAERWLQGQACHTNRGAWEVKSLRPRTQS